MLRRTGVVAAAVTTFVVMLGGASYADEPFDTIDKVAVTPVVGPGGIDTGGGVGQTRGNGAVVGAIDIEWQSMVSVNGGGPVYSLHGALADPNQWSCAGGGSGTSYTVRCLPQTLPVNVSYTCQVLHADIVGVLPGSAGRTTMDCDGDGTAEAQTDHVTGTDWDSIWAVSNTPVSVFTCTVDSVVPSVSARCGDPGAFTVE